MNGQADEIVSLELDILTPQGRIKGLFPIPRRMKLSDLAWFAMALDDRLVRMRLESTPMKGKDISCKKGCSVCCHQPVPLSPAEAFMIAELVASMPIERRMEILARFAKARRRLDEERFAETAGRGAAESPKAANQASVKYMRLGIPCPFLDDGACSIYARRPAACREYHVTTPSDYCVDPGAYPVQAVRLAKGLTQALIEICAQHAGTPNLSIPLVLALEWARNQPLRSAHAFDGESLVADLAARLSSPPAPEESGRSKGVAADGKP